jgi:hypothetical protein
MSWATMRDQSGAQHGERTAARAYVKRAATVARRQVDRQLERAALSDLERDDVNSAGGDDDH